MAVIWNTQQQQVIDHREGNLLVSAAAGSGKTAVLTEHVLKRVLNPEHPMGIDRLLIMTFTAAAASEMKDRIRKALQDALDNGGCDEKLRTHLRLQLTKLPYASISTIHSFCLNVIRENFFKIDLEPNLGIGDEAEIKLLLSDVIETVLESYYAEEDSEAFLSLGMLFGNRKSALARAIEELYGKCREYVDLEEFLEGTVDVYGGGQNEKLKKDIIAYEKKKLRPLLIAEAAALELADQISVAHPGSRHVSLFEGIAELARTAYNKETLTEAIDWLKDPANKIGSLRTNKKEDEEYSELYEHAKAEKKKITKLIDDVKKVSPFSWNTMEMELSRLRPQVVLLTQIVRQVHEQFQQKKKRLRLMDYSDMEHFAYKLLSYPEVAEVYRKRYEEILVDEYQDSNEMQDALIRSICREPEAPGKSNVFMVGDVKQSIYRFRRAKPELFIEKFNRYRAGDGNGTLICLNSNYRSREAILNGINSIFADLMTEERGGIVYDETARLNPGAAYPGDEEKIPRVLIDTIVMGDQNAPPETDVTGDGEDTPEAPDETNAGPDEGSKTDEESEEEERSDFELQAILIGKRIREILETEQVYDLKGKTYRSAQYRDIAILMRSVKNAEEQFLSVLRDEFGIPVVSTEGAAYFETPEVRDLIEFLRILDNPLQDIPLATVMASPMFDFTPEEMALIRLGAPAADRFFKAVEGYEGDDVFLGKKTDRFIRIFRDLRERSTFSTIPELLEMILQKTDYRSKISAMPGGRGREINVNMLLLKAADFEKTNYRGIDRFLRYIDRLKQKEIILSEPNKLSDEEDVVRVMTIHKSKGLEFPFVFLANAQKDLSKSNRNSSAFVYDPDYHLAFDYVNPILSVKIESNLKKIIRDKNQDEGLCEESRVLYVALTRAKEKMYVVGCIPAKERPDPEEPAATEFSDDDFFNKPTYLKWMLRSVRGKLRKTEMRPEATVYEGEDLAVILHSQKALETEFEAIRNASERAGDPAGAAGESEVPLSDEEAWAEIEKRFSYVYPYTALGDQKAIVSVSEVKHRFMEEEGVTFEEVGQSNPQKVSGKDDPVLDAASDENGKDAGKTACFVFDTTQEENTGALRGTAVHNVMEHLDFAETMKQADRVGYIKEKIRELTEKGILDETMQKLADSRKIARFFDSELAKKMACAQERGALKREVRFLYAIPAHVYLRDYQNAQVNEAVATQDDLVLVRGIIDAYYTDEDGHPVILDYKTDFLPENGGEEILTKRYLAQLKLYKDALESMMQTSVKACVLYSFSLGKEIPLPL